MFSFRKKVFHKKLLMKSALRKFLQERICTKITPALQFLLLINISVALFFYLFDIISGIDLHFYFSAYPTYSPHFHYYQLVTFMFVHSIDPLHIIFNVLFLLVFSANVEKKIGFNSFIIAYFVCAWVGYIFINQAYSINKIQIEERIISTGISPEKIPINDRHQVDDKYYLKLNASQINVVKEYNFVTSKTNGASGALFGIIVIYLFLNLLNYRKVLFLLFGFYTLYENYQVLLESSTQINGSCCAHLGGILGGLIIISFYLIIQLITKKYVILEQNERNSTRIIHTFK